MEAKKNGKHGKEEFSIQDFTVMKLMEEIVEFDQEIKMKQKWINSRMKLLHNIQQKQDKEGMKSIIGDFLQQIQPEYPRKLSVEYNRHENAIPIRMKDLIAEPVALHMADKYPAAIPMDEKHDEPTIEEEGKE